MLEGLPGDDKRWKITQCPGRAVGPLPLLKLLSAPPDPAKRRTHPWESLLFVQGALGLQG